MSIPIVFIFQGSKLPNYIEYSLKINRNLTPQLDIYFISNIKLLNKVEGIVEVDISSFYKSHLDSYFTNFKKNQWWDGFWNKTIERFLILEAFMKKFNLQSIIHMEIDNIAFNISDTAEIFSRLPMGLYYPTYPNLSSAASIMYVNGIKSIEDFNHYIIDNQDKTDMELLHEYRIKNHLSVYDLPVSVDDYGSSILGLFDLNVLGLYLFGSDRRVLKSINKNMFVYNNDLLTTLLGTNFKFQLQDNNVYLLKKGKKFKVNNLHIHSKIHKKLSKKKYLMFLFDCINEDRNIVIEFNFYYLLKNNLHLILLRFRNYIRGLITSNFEK